MSLPDAEWWSAQAAEYVLGTLSNDDHRLFERMLVNDADVRRLVVQWERRLQPLADTIAPVEPPPDLFRRVREAVLEGSANARVVDAPVVRAPVIDAPVVDARRVDARGADPRANDRENELRPVRDRPRGLADVDRTMDRESNRPADRPSSRRAIRQSNRQSNRDMPRDEPRGARARAPGDVAGRAPDSLLLKRLRRWRWAFAGSSMLAGGLAAGLAAVLLVPGLGLSALGGRFGDDTIATASPALPAFGGVASRVGLSLLSDADGTPRYLVEVDDASGQVRIVSLGAPPTPSGRSFELWVTDGQSGALRSVGLLPDEGWNGRIVDTFGDAVRDPAFAVSVEPAGGSPGDGPTGEVVFQGIIHPVDVEVEGVPGGAGPGGAGADGTAPEGRERGR